jgi:hypothetical protein
MKSGAIYLLSRQVHGDHGESYMQNVTVFAESAAQAKYLVDDQFSALRQDGRLAHERAYQKLPEFSVEKVSLEEYKMISAGITTY